MSDRPPSTSQLQQSLQAGDLLDPGVYLHWEQCRDSPMRINSNANSVLLNGKLYIGGGESPSYDVIRSQVLVYTPSEDSWEIIVTPAVRYALATYRSQLVLVGRDSGAGKVWLLEDGCRWVPHPTIPALPRSSPVLNAVGFDDYLLVVVVVEEGSFIGRRRVVKLYNGQTWFTGEVPEPPLQPFSPVPQCVVNGDVLYLCQWRAVHRTSLQSLVSSTVTPGAPPAQWEGLPDTPHSGSSITWFGGRLLAVGGFPGESDVHAYNHRTRKWEHVSDTPGEICYGSCYAVLPTGELLVVGGGRTPTRVLKGTITVSHTAETLSLTTTSDLLQAAAGLEALKEKLATKEGEHLHQQSAPGILTDPPLKAGGLEAGVKAESFSKHPTSSEHITEVFDTFEKTLLQSQAATGSKASLMLDTLSTAREEYCLTLELTEELEYENAMLKYKLLQFKLPPEELLSDIKPLVKPEIPVKQEIRREEMMSVAEPTSAPPTVAELRGVEAIAETFVRVTRAGRSFHWAGYGLKLTFPPNCLPPGVEECIIAIQASISGYYQLPEGATLVSGVYEVSCFPQCKFALPVILELEHCSDPKAKLSFATAELSAAGPPYRFSLCSGAAFSKESSYGSLELTSFSLFAIIARALSAFRNILSSPRSYCGHVYTAQPAGPPVWSVYFIVTQNLALHRRSAEIFAYKKRAILNREFSLQFKDEKLVLDTRESRLTSWDISASKPSLITRAEVDSFSKGRRVPHCQLDFEWSGSGRAERLKHDVAVMGTVHEGQTFPICIRPDHSSREVAGASGTASPREHSGGGKAIKRSTRGKESSSSKRVKVEQPTSEAADARALRGKHKLEEEEKKGQSSASSDPRATAVPTLRDYLNRLPAEVATATPSPKDVVNIATAMNDWQSLCSIMGFTDAEKKTIEENYKKEEHRRTAVLDMWKRRCGSAATFAELASVACEAKDLILVEKIIEVANQRSH